MRRRLVRIVLGEILENRSAVTEAAARASEIGEARKSWQQATSPNWCEPAGLRRRDPGSPHKAAVRPSIAFQGIRPWRCVLPRHIRRRDGGAWVIWYWYIRVRRVPPPSRMDSLAPPVRCLRVLRLCELHILRVLHIVHRAPRFPVIHSANTSNQIAGRLRKLRLTNSAIHCRLAQKWLPIGGRSVVISRSHVSGLFGTFRRQLSRTMISRRLRAILAWLLS